MKIPSRMPDESEDQPRPLTRWARLLMPILLIGVLFLITTQYSQEVQSSILLARPIYFLVAIPPALTTLLLRAVGWSLILRRFSRRLPWESSLRIYFYSNLTRYLPGSIWFAVSRVALCRDKEIPIDSATASLAMELIVAVLSGILLFVGGIIFGVYDSDPNVIQAGLGLSVAVFLVLIFVAALWKSNLVRNLLNRLRISFDLLEKSRSNLPFWVLIFLVSWLTQGISLYLTLLAWEGLPIQSLVIITITYASGWVAGFLFPFAPNGLGIREGIIVVGLGSLISPPLALTASLALRIVVLGAEALWATLFWLLSFRH